MIILNVTKSRLGDFLSLRSFMNIVLLDLLMASFLLLKGRQMSCYQDLAGMLMEAICERITSFIVATYPVPEYFYVLPTKGSFCWWSIAVQITNSGRLLRQT